MSETPVSLGEPSAQTVEFLPPTENESTGPAPSPSRWAKVIRAVRTGGARLLALPLEERDRWFLWIPLGLCLGSVLYATLPFEPSLAALVLAPLALALAVATRRRLVLGALAAACTSLALGFNAAQLETQLMKAPMLDRTVGPAPITGRLILAEPLPEGTRLTLDHLVLGHLPPDRTPDRVRIKVKTNLRDLPPPGTRLDLWGEVRPNSEPLAPGAYDFRRHAFFMGLGGTGWTYGPVRVAAEPEPPPALFETQTFLLPFEHARRVLALRVDQVTKGDAAAMTSALITGEQTGISQDTMKAMRASGLTHLLSISGLHVSMMALLVYVPLRLLFALIPWIALRWPTKKIAAVGAIVSTAAYTLLVGPQTPTLRSAVTTALVMLAVIADRRALSMRILALSASCVILLSPSAVLGPSFQMSFAAVLAMVAVFEKPLDKALADPFHPFDDVRWPALILRNAGRIALTSLVATAATAPFVIYHFQNFSFYGAAANMLGVPLTSFWIMPCILLTYIAAPFGADAVFILATQKGVEVLIGLANDVAAWPGAMMSTPPLSLGALMAFVGGGAWLCLWRKRWRFAGLVPIALALCSLAFFHPPSVLIDPEGATWAVRLTDGRLAVPSVTKSTFVLKQWQQRFGMLPLVDARDPSVPPEELRCDPGGCVAFQGTHTVALPRTPSAAFEDCALAEVVLTPLRLNAASCVPTQALVDGHALAQHGAFAVTFPPNAAKPPVLEFSRPRSGQHPWSPQGQSPGDGVER